MNIQTDSGLSTGYYLVALDWDTSSLRATLVDPHGTVLESRASGQGIQFVKDGRFEEPCSVLSATGWTNAGR